VYEALYGVGVFRAYGALYGILGPLRYMGPFSVCGALYG
jgi:hypothetical protein